VTFRSRRAGCRAVLPVLLVAGSLILPSSAQADADLSITKTADKTVYAPGGQIIYTLRVHNDGPDPTGATATDVLPPGVTFVSSGPGCSYAPGPNTVTCNYNFLAPGGFETQSFIVQVNPNFFTPAATPVPPHVHPFTADKIEKYIDLDPGQTRHETISCPAQLPVMTDGTAHIEHVDQGTGTFADIEISQARTSALGSYEFTITNHATGRAQVKLFGVCLSNPGTVDGHTHPLLMTGPFFGNTNFGTGGYHEAFSAACPAETQPTSPGIMFFGPTGRVVKSEQVTYPGGTTGWVFGYVMPNAPNTTQVSIRCMNRTLPGATHSHQLLLHEIFRNISVGPGKSVHRLDCGTYASDAKGITATYDFDHQGRMMLAGTNPQPIIRDFTFYNPTAGPLPAYIDLICMRMRTGPAQPPSQTPTITNTATVSGPLPDPFGPNSDSVTVAVDANDPPVVSLSFAAKLISGVDKGVAIDVTCKGEVACEGTIGLRAKIRRGHGKRAWKVVAGGPLSTSAGTTATVTLPLTARGARKLGAWRKDSSLIAETALADGSTTRERLRLKKR
jgi:uncharacterized repeat protein (TIGR01451 family)